MSIQRGRSIVVVIFISLFLAPLAHAQTPSFDAFYVFGDSLADNGNDLLATKLLHANPAVPPSESPHRTYFKGRFSNGYVAFEYLWQRLSGNAPGSAGGLRPFLGMGLAGLSNAIDFAFGGTGTPILDQTPGGQWLPGLKGQVELYRAAQRTQKSPKRALFAIVTGANDYRDDQFNVPMSIDDVVANIIDAVTTLYGSGARDIMVVNLPDLGIIPANAADSQSASQLSVAHNAALKAALNALQRRLPRLHLMQPDLFEAFTQLPAGMQKTIPLLEVVFAGDPTLPPNFHMSACLFVEPVTCKDSPVPFNTDFGFLFWDVVHPTTEAHRSLSNYLFDVLSASYAQ